MVDLFFRAAITNYHRLSGLNNKIVLSHSVEAESPRSMCHQGWFFLRVVREDLSRPLSLTCRWLSSHCVSLHHLFPVSICVQISPSYKDISHTGLGPTLMLLS